MHESKGCIKFFATKLQIPKPYIAITIATITLPAVVTIPLIEISLNLKFFNKSALCTTKKALNKIEIDTILKYKSRCKMLKYLAKKGADTKISTYKKTDMAKFVVKTVS